MKDFLTTTQTHPPQIPLPYYLLMLLAMVLLSYLSWRWYKNKIWRWTFLTFQAIQLFALYTWYLWQGFPLYISLPLYHCRMAMFAVLLLKNSRIKSYFAIMGVVGTYCALIYPVFDPYEFPHITGFSFLIGHYARSGLVTGPGTGTSDSIAARLSNGEAVMTARAVVIGGRCSR